MRWHSPVELASVWRGTPQAADVAQDSVATTVRTATKSLSGPVQNQVNAVLCEIARRVPIGTILGAGAIPYDQAVAPLRGENSICIEVCMQAIFHWRVSD